MTTTYSDDDDITAHCGDATDLLRDSDSGSFNRLRVVIKNMIDVAMDNRVPRQVGVVGAQSFIELEVSGVLAMLYRENATSGLKDLNWAQSEFWQKQYDYLIENVRGTVVETYEDADEDEMLYGNEISFDRC